MKEATQEQHKITLGIMSGFYIFWGMILGALSFVIALAIPSIIFLIFMYISGSV